MCFFKNHQITIQTMRGKQHKSISLGRQMWAEGGSWRKGGVLVRRPIAPTRRLCPRTTAPTRRIRPSVPRSLSARCPAHPEARARSAPPRLPGKSAPPPHLPGDTPRHLTPLAQLSDSEEAIRFTAPPTMARHHARAIALQLKAR